MDIHGDSMCSYCHNGFLCKARIHRQGAESLLPIPYTTSNAQKFPQRAIITFTYVRVHLIIDLPLVGFHIAMFYRRNISEGRLHTPDFFKAMGNGESSVQAPLVACYCFRRISGVSCCAK
jgi:hypothetical protein